MDKKEEELNQISAESAADQATEEQVLERINQVDLRQEMQRSYLDYAMSVIVGRALPDVRDGLKPVHRRVIYAMYRGGYRPDKAFSKAARVVGDVMGQYHPHGDGAIYDALVRLVQPWALRYPLAQGQGNFGSPGNDGAAAPRYTETKMATLALEMVRDIDEDTVTMVPNYDGENQEPTVLPSRFPNLLVNGSVGIAVGMATNIPPHNLREVGSAALWRLENSQASREEAVEALMERIKGPDFPTGATIVGTQGIEDAYRTGRGSITMRAVVEVEELAGRACLVVTELPYQVNPDTLALKIASLIKEGRLPGIADIRDETSGRTGQRLVIVLKKDAVAHVVRNNLFKHTQLQENFGANMLAIVDSVPRKLTLVDFIDLWIQHQVEVIVRRSAFRLRKAEERAHILRGYLRVLDRLDEAIALIRASSSAEAARRGLEELLGIDDLQSRAVLELQLRRLVALERQKIIAEAEEIERHIADLQGILSSDARQREIVSLELGELLAKHGDERRTRIIPAQGELSMEDLIPEEAVVITMTREGYVKRTISDLFRLQHRGGKGIRGAKLREADLVAHFFTTTTHSWVMFFTNTGRVYRIKAYEIPDAGRDARGLHVANLLALRPGETIAGALAIRSFAAAGHLLLATRSGYVKKTPLSDYDVHRSNGIIAVALREGDELVSAMLGDNDTEMFLVSRNGRCLRFTVDDQSLRPLSRNTQGVRGIHLKEDDELLAATVISDHDNSFVFSITEKGYAKRSPAAEYKVQGRGGQGAMVAAITSERGRVADILVVSEEDEVLTVLKSGKIVRSLVKELPPRKRPTKGMIFTRLSRGDQVLAIARSTSVLGQEDTPDGVTEEESSGEHNPSDSIQ